MASLTLTLNVTDPAPGLHNDDRLVKQILARLKRGPSTNDSHGYLYMYKEQGKINAYRKIGRTERLPARRVDEWPGAVLVKSWRCRRNRHAELLVHWLLDEVRVHRYVVAVDTKTGAETLLSAWKRTGLLIQDPTYKALPATGRTVKGRKRHQEWFMAFEKKLIAIVEAVVRDVNEHWKAEPWSAEMELMK